MTTLIPSSAQEQSLYTPDNLIDKCLDEVLRDLSRQRAIPPVKEMVSCFPEKTIPYILDAIDEVKTCCGGVRVSAITFVAVHHGLAWLDSITGPVRTSVGKAKSVARSAGYLELPGYLDRSSFSEHWAAKKAVFRASNTDMGRISDISGAVGLGIPVLIQVAIAWSLSTSLSTEIDHIKSKSLLPEVGRMTRLTSFQLMVAEWINQQVTVH